MMLRKCAGAGAFDHTEAGAAGYPNAPITAADAIHRVPVQLRDDVWVEHASVDVDPNCST